MANPERPTSHRPFLDLLDGDFYVNDPYPTYAWMRDNEPLYWDEVNELWGVSRYDDIVTIERDKFRFTNSGNEKGGYRPNIPADASIIALDDPHHTARRNLVSRRFTPRAAGTWEDHVRGVVTGLLDDLAETGGAEVVSELASPLPAQMIGLLLGFPHESWPSLRDWSERTIALGGGPRYHNDDGIMAVFEFTEACMDVYESSRSKRSGGGCPADTVMDTWVDREVEGPVNLVAPGPVTNAEFARTLGCTLGRPARLPVPSLMPMLLFGRDLVRELMLASSRVRPRVLEDTGFSFEDPELGGALDHLITGR